MWHMARDHVCSMHVEENTPFVTEYEKVSTISVQKRVKSPLTGTLKNIMIWPRTFLINIDNIAVGGNASFLIRFRIGSLTMYVKQIILLQSLV